MSDLENKFTETVDKVQDTISNISTPKDIQDIVGKIARDEKFRRANEIRKGIAFTLLSVLYSFLAYT